MKGNVSLLVPVLALLQNCITVEITQNTEMILPLHTIRLSQSVTLTSLGLVDINNSAFFPSSFRIETPDKIIYIDPAPEKVGAVIH